MNNDKRSFFQEEQENMIMTLLKNNGCVSVEEITQMVNVSPSTARIRLNSMSERGLLTRTHGGAVMKELSINNFIATKEIPNLREKEAVARAARKTVQDGDIIAVGGGMTTLVFAQALHGIKNLTVVTSSIFVANELISDPDIQVRISGGVLNRRTGGCFGPTAENFFNSIFVSKSYNSVDSITAEHGFTLHDADARTDKALISCARERYTLADHTKLFMGPFLDPISSFSEVRALIIDSGADTHILTKLREAGLNIIVAEMADK
ncbi:MAG: DeoR/GlpR family DNA-binding transcription regulator [Acetivibrionales bacterium]|jgi:DeoR/GlpR family transcriptional regulator of sugar metabolism